MTQPVSRWWVRSGVLGLLGLGVTGAPAWSQQTPPGPADGPAGAPEDVAPEDAAAVVAPAPPAPWADDYSWGSAGLDAPILSLTTTASGTRLALTADGAVMRSVQGGPWRQSLTAPGAAEAESSSDEDVLLEAEATVDELLAEPSTDATPSSQAQSQDTTDSATTDLSTDATDVPTSDATQTQVADTDLGDQLDEAVEAAQEEATGAVAAALRGTVWASGVAPDHLLAGRGDGLWASLDEGRSWTLVSAAPSVQAVLELTPGHLLAGSGAGLLESADGGRTWQPEHGELGARPVHALAQVGQALLAGTDDGLYLSVDGQRWVHTADPARSGLVVYDLLADPSWEGGLWLATSEGVLRSDDLGQTQRVASRNPLVGTADLLALPEAGHLLAGGSQGVWESTDGGVTWQPLPQGLPGQQVVSLALDGTTPLAGGGDGVFQLGRAPRGSRAAVRRPEESDQPPLAVVVGHSLNRPGLDISDLTMSTARIVSAHFAPRLQFQLKHRVSRYRSTLYESLRTTEQSAPYTTVTTQLCWGACSSFSTTSYEPDVTDLGTTFEDLGLGDDVAVIDGEVYDMGDEGALPSAAANVAQRATSYRTDLARIVSDAWLSRRRLVSQEPSLGDRPLGDQVAHALLLAEVTARLDAYTDGWFSRAMSPPAAP